MFFQVGIGIALVANKSTPVGLRIRVSKRGMRNVYTATEKYQSQEVLQMSYINRSLYFPKSQLRIICIIVLNLVIQQGGFRHK